MKLRCIEKKKHSWKNGQRRWMRLAKRLLIVGIWEQRARFFRSPGQTRLRRCWNLHFRFSESVYYKRWPKDLGLALPTKMRPDQSQAFKEVNNSQAFAVGGEKITHFFSWRAASRCFKAYLYNFSSKYFFKNWLLSTNMKSNFTPENRMPGVHWK